MGNRVCPKGLDRSRYDIVCRWMETCLKFHPFCTQDSDFPLPTRLLSLAGNRIKLINSASLNTKAKYTALSHCWGACEFLRLTEKSLDEMMDSISLEKLTKTFQEAILFTRSIGIDYIWIDSLCIIQDSKKDWEIESCSMSSVYRGCTITIAATGAANGSVGCFFGPPNSLRCVRLESAANEPKRSWSITQPSEYITWTALGHRAWSVQERILSPRVLHFGSLEIMWECKFGHATEHSPEIARREQERYQLSARWDKIVEQYCSGALTYSKDKLVAISGIAKVAAEETGDQYLAGLWKRNIESQLLWTRAAMNRQGRPPSCDPYRAPSWSWASIDGAILYEDASPLFTCKWAHVLSCSVSYAGTDPFVQVTNGTLEVCCRSLLPGFLKFKPTDSHRAGYGYFESQHFDIRVSADSFSEDEVFLLPMFDNELPVFNKETRGRCIKGIVLTPGVKKGEFQRTGYWSLYGILGEFDLQRTITYYDECVDYFVGLLEGIGVQTAESECMRIEAIPKYMEERYVITIV